jgi:hypothetical protein
MSRRKLLVKRQVVEYGGVPPMPADRVKSTRPGPDVPPSNKIVTEPMSERKRELWTRWASGK